MKNTPSKGLLLVGGVVVVMAIIVLIVGRGGMANLGSNAFGNVCTRASLESGKVQYEQGALNLIKMSSEKDHLTKIVTLGKQEIKKNNAQIQKFENQEKATKQTISNLQKLIKNSCSGVTKTIATSGRGGSQPNPLYTTCENKKKELAAAQQDLQQTQNSLAKEKEQNRKRTATVKNAESRIRALDKQIQDITNYRTGYDACKGSISGEVTISGEVFVASISAPTTVTVNTPFTVEVGIKNKGGSLATSYTGTVYMEGVNADLLCYLDDICTWDDVTFPNQDHSYTFTSADQGTHSFTNGFTIKRAGTYRLYINIPADAPAYYKQDFVNIIVK